MTTTNLKMNTQIGKPNMKMNTAVYTVNLKNRLKTDFIK